MHDIQHPGGKTTTSKAEKNNWPDINDKGDFQWVPLTMLNIDGRYQRAQVSKGKVLRIAREWNWLLCGTLLVVRRTDGSLWIFDGGHRARAAFYRDGVDEMPCMIYNLSSLSDEAKAFVDRNTMISGVRAVTKYKAMIVAGDQTAKDIAALMDELGIDVNGSAHSPYQLSCIGAVIGLFVRNRDIAERYIRLLAVAAKRDGVCIKANLLGGFFEVGNKYDDEKTHAKMESLIEKNSLQTFDIKIRQHKAETGKGGAVSAARAILGMYNYKKQNKMKW